MDDAKDFDRISLLRLAFKGLEEAELRELASLTRLVTYPAGHVLCQEDAYEETFYVVADGSILVTKRMNGDESEHVLRSGGRGDLVGEMGLIQHTARTATVRTTSECTVLEMDKQDFEAILGRSPHMAIDLIGITLDRIRANDRMMIADLEKTNKVLRQLDRNKLEFIQVAAHELRTPLTVLKGYANVLGSYPDVRNNPALTDVVDGIARGAERMHEVVNMMLDVSRIDSETAQVARGPVFVKRVVDALILDFKKAVAERNIELVAEHAGDVPVINADPALVKKALYQLIVNAIKYTPDGGRVLVCTRPVLLDGDMEGVEVMVRDTGIGLDAEHHELVFEKFYQVGSVAIHSSGRTTFKGGGPGLGLALVRGVARAHGGKTWVESAGHDETSYPGCSFYLQLPVNPRKSPSQKS